MLLLAFCLIYGWLGQDVALLPAQEQAAFHPRTLPNFLAALGIALSALLLAFPPNHEPVHLKGLRWLRFAAFLALMSLYGLSIRPLGFIASTSLFLIAGFALSGERGLLKMIAIGAGVAIAFWAIMDPGLGVFIDPLPSLLSRAS